MREIWAGMRDTTFVVAQVVTLGVLAMVLGLVALNAVLAQPAGPATPTPQGAPSRPLSALVPTIVAATPSPTPPAEPTPTLFVPPGFLQATATAVRTEPPGEPTRAAAAPPAAQPAAPTATPRPPEPTETPRPSPTAGPPARASATPTARPVTGATGQMMKVRTTGDGLPARVRAEPTTKSPILLRVPLGSTVEVIGQANGEPVQPGNPKWLRIRWKEQTGWVYSTLLGE